MRYFPFPTTLQAQTCLICALLKFSSNPPVKRNHFLCCYSASIERVKRGCHTSHIYTRSKKTNVYEIFFYLLYQFSRKVSLTGFIEVYNPRTWPHNTCNWQATKVKISLEVPGVTFLKRIVKLWNTWNASPGLHWLALQSSLLSISQTSLVEWIYLLYLQWRALGEKTTPAWDKNLIKERSEMKKAFGKYNWTLTGMVFTLQEPPVSIELRWRNRETGINELLLYLHVVLIRRLRETDSEERRSDNDFTPEILPGEKRAMGSGIDLTLRKKEFRIHLNFRCCDQTWALNDLRTRADVERLMLLIITRLLKVLSSKVTYSIFKVYILSVWPAIQLDVIIHYIIILYSI